MYLSNDLTGPKFNSIETKNREFFTLRLFKRNARGEVFQGEIDLFFSMSFIR